LNDGNRLNPDAVGVLVIQAVANERHFVRAIGGGNDTEMFADFGLGGRAGRWGGKGSERKDCDGAAQCGGCEHVPLRLHFSLPCLDTDPFMIKRGRGEKSNEESNRRKTWLRKQISPALN
jgi:hypothetical protein